MDSLPKITAGQPGWDKVWNEVVSILKSGIEGVVSDTGWVSDGITLLNGVTIYDDTSFEQPMYRVVSFSNGTKMVSIHARLQGCTANKVIMQVPGSWSNATRVRFGTQLYSATVSTNGSGLSIFLDSVFDDHQEDQLGIDFTTII